MPRGMRRYFFFNLVSLTVFFCELYLYRFVVLSHSYEEIKKRGWSNGQAICEGVEQESPTKPVARCVDRKKHC